jgi:hypothetical protein
LVLHRADPEGLIVIGQPAHAWVSGQIARAWGNERFGHFEPWEDVCLAAEQHDLGMAAVTVVYEGRRLERRFSDEQAMCDALSRARWLTLTTRLRPA